MPQNYSLTLAFIEPKDNRKAIFAAAQSGIRGATIVYGRGTVSNKLLAALGMDSLRKELVLFIGEEDLTDDLHTALKDALTMSRHGHGIAITLPLVRVFGLANMVCDLPKGANHMQHELITVIVDNGRGDDIVEAAQRGGASGATILHGRGSGAERVEKFFNLEIDPEKELVLIVADEQQAESIVDHIREAVDFSQPNSGILFSLAADAVTGLLRK